MAQSVWQMTTASMVYTMFAGFIGGPFIYGWNINCVGLPGSYIKKFINSSMYDHYSQFDKEGDDTLQKALFSVCVLLLSLGGAIGGFLSATMMDKFGRKRAVLLTHVLTLISAALYGICKVSGCFELLFLARLLVGFSSGACFAIVPVYATEITPIEIRGAVGTCSQLAITIGILVSTVFVLGDTLGTEELWPIGMALMAVFCLVSSVMLMMPFAAESPKWLLIVKNDLEAAKHELRKLYKRENVDDLVDEIRKEANILPDAPGEIQKPKDEDKWTFGRLLSSRQLRWPLALVVIMNAAQQLSGINVVFFFSTSLYEGAGFKSEQERSYASLVVNAINVVTTIVAVPLINKFGRRVIMLYPMILMVTAMIGQVVLLSVKERVDGLSESDKQGISWAAIVCVALFVIGFALGLGPIPNFSASEMFRPAPRATAAAVGTVTNLVCTLLVSVLFENVFQTYLKEFSFLPFLAISVLSLIFLWIKLPETKNRPITDIYRELGCPEPNEAIEMNKPVPPPPQRV